MDGMTWDERRKVREARAHEEALDMFLARKVEAERLARKITEFLGDHMGVNPDEVGWDNAGDAGRLVEQLREICETYRLDNQPSRARRIPGREERKMKRYYVMPKDAAGQIVVLTATPTNMDGVKVVDLLDGDYLSVANRPKPYPAKKVALAVAMGQIKLEEVANA